MKKLLLCLLLTGCASQQQTTTQPPPAITETKTIEEPTIVSSNKKTVIVSKTVAPSPAVALPSPKSPTTSISNMPMICAQHHCPRILYPRHTITNSTGCDCRDNCHCK